MAYPVRQIDLSLLGNKLQHASMSGLLRLPVNQLKEHRVFNVQLAELLECGWWHEDLAAIIETGTLGARQHYCWVASIVFIESPRSSSALQCSVHSHWVITFVEPWVEL
jgi:hypothetical protein